MFLVALTTVVVFATDSTSKGDTTQYTTHAVVVEADQCAAACTPGMPRSQMMSVDDMMTQGGAGLIRRAAFAAEPVVRGLRGGQLALSIDGMKVHSACVDKMDPATAYVELDNVRSLQLTEGVSDTRYGSTLGGALTFTMQPPSLERSLHGGADVGYDANARGTRIRATLEGGTGQGAVGDVAVRSGYTFRSAEDYRAGGNTVIDGSGYTKHNLTVAGTWKTSASLTTSIRMIGDLALDVGYPSMYMDTRRAEALIVGIDQRYAFASGTSLSWKLYGNHVRHWMDDSTRSLSEIMTRPFMPGMYMPMFGRTTTIGALAEYSTVIGSDLVTVVLDAFALEAYADMQMIAVDDPSSKASLTTIGTARAATVAVAPVYEHVLGADCSLRLNGRLETSQRNLDDPTSRDALASYGSVADFSPFLVAGTLNATLYYDASESVQLSVGLARAQRLPTHIEQYGYYLYDPGANIITIGAPDLRVETSYIADIGVHLRTEDASVSLTASASRVNNYIAAVVSIGSDPSSMLRRYANAGDAAIVGATLRWSWRFTNMITMSGTMSATSASMITFTDNLPLIPAPQATWRCSYGNVDRWVAVQLRTVAPQRSVSSIILPEDGTAGYATLDLTSAYTVMPGLVVRASLLNVFDTFYHEHTSLRNIAAQGRALTLSLGYAFQ